MVFQMSLEQVIDSHWNKVIKPMDGKITVWERRKVWEDICWGRKVVEDPSQFLNGGTVLSFEEVSYLIVPSLSVIWFSFVCLSLHRLSLAWSSSVVILTFKSFFIILLVLSHSIGNALYVVRNYCSLFSDCKFRPSVIFCQYIAYHITLI